MIAELPGVILKCDILELKLKLNCLHSDLINNSDGIIILKTTPQELQLAISAAHKAGTLIMKYYKSEYEMKEEGYHAYSSRYAG